MKKQTKKSGDGTPEDSIPTYPTPADKLGGGRPPKEPVSEDQKKARERQQRAEENSSGETGFAGDHGKGQDPAHGGKGGKLDRALKETERAAKDMPSPHASEDKGDQASGTPDAEGEGDRGEHRSGGSG